MNYRYRVDGTDIVVSPEENDRIKEEIKNGKSIVYLRNDGLAINVNFIRYIKETDQLTDEQEKVRDESLKLESPKWIPPTKEDIERRKKMMEDWKKKHNKDLT